MAERFGEDGFSLEQMLRQDTDHSSVDEGDLYAGMRLLPSEVITRESTPLFGKIGNFFARRYDAVENFFAVARPAVRFLSLFYTANVGINILFSAGYSPLLLGSDLVIYAGVVGYLGYPNYKEFKEVRSHLDLHGWDEDYMRDKMENRPPLKIFRRFGGKISERDYTKILRHAAKKAGYLDKFEEFNVNQRNASLGF